jgi:hypothetical protein
LKEQKEYYGEKPRTTYLNSRQDKSELLLAICNSPLNRSTSYPDASLLLVPNKDTLASARYLSFCNLSYSTSTDSYAFCGIPDCTSHANFIKGRSLEKGTYYRDQ